MANKAIRLLPMSSGRPKWGNRHDNRKCSSTEEFATKSSISFVTLVHETIISTMANSTSSAREGHWGTTR